MAAKKKKIRNTPAPNSVENDLVTRAKEMFQQRLSLEVEQSGKVLASAQQQIDKQLEDVKRKIASSQGIIEENLKETVSNAQSIINKVQPKTTTPMAQANASTPSNPNNPDKPTSSPNESSSQEGDVVSVNVAMALANKAVQQTQDTQQRILQGIAASEEAVKQTVMNANAKLVQQVQAMNGGVQAQSASPPQAQQPAATVPQPSVSATAQAVAAQASQQATANLQTEAAQAQAVAAQASQQANADLQAETAEAQSMETNGVTESEANMASADSAITDAEKQMSLGAA